MATTVNQVSRRNFLKTGGALVVSFAAANTIRMPAYGQEGIAAAPALDSFLGIQEDGSVVLRTSYVDVGTGIETALRQIAAEELGIPAERFTVLEGDTDIAPDHGGTGGSRGIPNGGKDIRLAAATARQAILKLASEQTGRSATDLEIVKGMVQPKAGGSGVSVASLVGGKRLELSVDPNAPLKNPASYSVVGKPVLRADVPNKCTGKHGYLQDLSLPGMLHARIVRPPAHGASLLSVDKSSIRGIPDVHVVRIQHFLGVVAQDEWAAIRGARELKASWGEWQGLPSSEDFENYMLQADVGREETVEKKGGDFDAGIAAAAKQLSATYFWPFQSHASLGPSCAVADVRPSKITVWSSTQNTFGLRNALAKTLGVAEEKVRVVYLDGSGSYGTNGANDAAADAALLSKALGQPVRVQWSREDELGWDPKGPAQLLKLRGGLDAQGNIVAWESQMWLPAGPAGQRSFLGADSAGIPQGKGQPAGRMTMDAHPPYANSSMRVIAHHLKDNVLRLSNLRAPGKIANVFAVESFTDELAAVSSVDPVEFRLARLSDPRALDAIKRAASLFGWESRKAGKPRAAKGDLLTGQGFAYSRYKHSENYVAMAMEVAVNRSTGVITVLRVACAHDCGLIVNPDGLRNQVEGNIMQTLSRALHEEVKFDRSHITSVDWGKYPILRFREAPRMEVSLINRPDQPSHGAGEAACSPVAAAVANAIFDATGVRLRTVPFTAARMKSAFQAG